MASPTPEQIERLLSALESGPALGPDLAAWASVGVTTIGLGIAIYQIYGVKIATKAAVEAAATAAIELEQNRKIAEREVERAKRELAVATLTHFNENSWPFYSAMSQIVSKMDNHQIENLAKDLPFSIRAVDQDLFYDIVRGLNENAETANGSSPKGQLEGNEYTPTRDDQIEFRSLVVRSVNHLEAALIPLFSKIADEEIMLEQLRPYFVNDIGKRLDKVRESFGSAMLPNTIRMMREIEKESEPGAGKSPLSSL